MKKDALVAFRVPEGLMAEIQDRAKKERILVSTCVRRLLHDGFDKRSLTKKEKAALRGLLA